MAPGHKPPTPGRWYRGNQRTGRRGRTQSLLLSGAGSSSSQGILVFIMHTVLEVLSPISWSLQWEGAKGSWRTPLSTFLPPVPERIPHRSIQCSALCQIQDHRKVCPSWTRTQPQALPECLTECFHVFSGILPTSSGERSSEDLKPSPLFIQQFDHTDFSGYNLCGGGQAWLLPRAAGSACIGTTRSSPLGPPLPASTKLILPQACKCFWFLFFFSSTVFQGDQEWACQHLDGTSEQPLESSLSVPTVPTVLLMP